MTAEIPRNSRWPWVLAGCFTLAGLVLRLLLLGHSGFGDEMSTLWIVEGNDFTGTVSAVYSDAEISPPLYFILAEISTVFGETVTAIRLPSVVAGVASIPLYFVVGRMALGTRAAIYATALAATSPFLVYFSANARAYSVMILLILLATLALLLATSGRGRWWQWLGWAVAGALAVYSHYTAALVIAGQAVWVLCCFPALRSRVIVWSIVSALLFLPWAWGLKADLDSPTSEILQALQKGGFDARIDETLQLFFLRISQDPWELFWDRPDMILGYLGAIVAVVGLAAGFARRALRFPTGERGRAVLLAGIMTFSVIGGELLLLALGTDIYGARNLAAVWAGLPLLIAAGCAGAGTVTGLVSIFLIVAGFSVSSAHIAHPENTTIAYGSAADLIEGRQAAGGSVLDGSIVSPAPQTPLDAYLDPESKVFRLTAIEDSRDFIEHIYDPYDPQAITDRAFDGPGPVELVTVGAERTPVTAPGPGGSQYRFRMESSDVLVPAGWKQVSQVTFEGLEPLTVTRYERAG